MAHGSSPRVRGTPSQLTGGPRGRRFIPACAGNSLSLLWMGSWTPVHPRVCGELVRSCPQHENQPGSSPRVRGTPARAQWERYLDRFIPACAGNSSLRSMRRYAACGSSPRVRGTRYDARTRCRFATVHPRVCGELDPRRKQRAGGQRFIPACAGNSTLTVGFGVSGTGSSPRVRGTRRGVGPDLVHGRFIPACAGNSSMDATPGDWLTVHPRVCGELAHLGQPRGERPRFIPACAGNSPSRKESTMSCTGSSPRVRGTQRERRWRPEHRRFIPACAGNSPSSPRPRVRAAVHPRVCGELCWTRRGCSASGRFIPACAGNSLSYWLCLRMPPVHPRVCGELQVRTFAHRRCNGSSPRVRGTRAQQQRREIGVRFIPACAGNSQKPPLCRRMPPVHPRVCGELARLSGALGGVRRFIPACAGNSCSTSARPPPRPVHPRVCGELAVDRAATAPEQRFIPACAGNSLA